MLPLRKPVNDGWHHGLSFVAVSAIGLTVGATVFAFAQEVEAETDDPAGVEQIDVQGDAAEDQTGQIVNTETQGAALQIDPSSEPRVNPASSRGANTAVQPDCPTTPGVASTDPSACLGLTEVHDESPSHTADNEIITRDDGVYLQVSPTNSD